MKLGSSAPVTYAYNNLDQLTGTSFGKHYYDARGNLLNSSGVSSYQHDAMDRLITATVTAGTAGYGYDHNGRRVKQTSGVTITNYLWDEVSAYGDVLIEADNSWNIQTSYTLGNGEIIGQNRSSTLSYYLMDGHSGVRGLTNSSGSLTDSYAYGAFGDLKNSSGTTAINYHYTGQQFDSLTGLYSLRARYYNPSEGRFLSRDTWQIDQNNPIELNRYGYTANNPINASDPTGFELETYGPRTFDAVKLKKILVWLGVGTLALIALMLFLAKVSTDVGTIDVVKPKPTQNPDKPLYRGGGKSAKNLTPRAVDVDSGLSMSETPQKGWLFVAGKRGLQALGFIVEADPTPTDSGHVLVKPGPGHVAQGWTLKNWSDTRDTIDENDPLT